MTSGMATFSLTVSSWPFGVPMRVYGYIEVAEAVLWIGDLVLAMWAVHAGGNGGENSGFGEAEGC